MVSTNSLLIVILIYIIILFMIYTFSIYKYVNFDNFKIYKF